MKLLLLVIFSVGVANSQLLNNIIIYSSDPSGSCPAKKLAVSSASPGNIFYCNANTSNWSSFSTGGSLPSQVGASGKYLSTNGSSASWQPCATAGDSGATTVTVSGGFCKIDLNFSLVPSLTQSNVWLGAQDFSGSSSTSPVKVAATAPASCNAAIREQYFNSALNTLFSCNTTNTWSAVGAIGGSGTTNYMSYWTSSSSLGAISKFRYNATTGSTQWIFAGDSGNCTIGPYSSGSGPTTIRYDLDCSATAGSQIKLAILGSSNSTFSSVDNTGSVYSSLSNFGSNSQDTLIAAASQLFKTASVSTQTITWPTTNVLTTPGTMSLVKWYISANSGTGTVTMTFACASGLDGTRTFTTAALTLSTTAFSSGVVPMACDGSGNPTYSTTLVGTGNYNLFITISGS